MLLHARATRTTFLRCMPCPLAAMPRPCPPPSVRPAIHNTPPPLPWHVPVFAGASFSSSPCHTTMAHLARRLSRLPPHPRLPCPRPQLARPSPPSAAPFRVPPAPAPPPCPRCIGPCLPTRAAGRAGRGGGGLGRGGLGRGGWVGWGGGRGLSPERTAHGLVEWVDAVCLSQVGVGSCRTATRRCANRRHTPARRQACSKCMHAVLACMRCAHMRRHADTRMPCVPRQRQRYGAACTGHACAPGHPPARTRCDQPLSPPLIFGGCA